MRAIIASLLLLSACKTTPGPVEVRVQRVMVPISQPCVKASQIPKAPPRIGDQLNGDSQHDLNLVAASAVRLRAYGDALLALVVACE